jgi:hypothetical protein
MCDSKLNELSRTDVSQTCKDERMKGKETAPASTFETSINFHQTTRCNIPENSYLHTGHRENLKSHLK